MEVLRRGKSWHYMRSMIGWYHALQLESEERFVLLNLSCDLRCPLLAGNAVCHVGMTAGDDVCETAMRFCSGSCFKPTGSLLNGKSKKLDGSNTASREMLFLC